MRESRLISTPRRSIDDGRIVSSGRAGGAQGARLARRTYDSTEDDHAGADFDAHAHSATRSA